MAKIKSISLLNMPKENWDWGGLSWSCRYGATHLKPNFLIAQRLKMKNVSAYHKEKFRNFLRISKITLLLFLVQFLRESWPLKHGSIFFGTGWGQISDIMYDSTVTSIWLLVTFSAYWRLTRTKYGPFDKICLLSSGVTFKS